MPTVKQYCTFYVAGHLYGVEVERVQEILRIQQMTVIPLAPREVHGLINLRGEIVAAIDLRSRLELPPRPEDAEPTNVVLRDEEGALSLLVDEIGEVIDTDEGELEPPPETLRGSARKLVQGVYKLEDGLLLVLDIAEAINVQTVEGAVRDDERSLLAPGKEA